MKILILLSIIVVSFWLGRLSAGGGGNTKIIYRDKDSESTVIDIEPEDK